jgi:acetylornithine deacetylase/succinyl-diaminopimelate desuccinylase-like protein
VSPGKKRWAQRIQKLKANPQTQKMLQYLQQAHPIVVEDIINICEIPAPSFEERERAEHVAKRMKELGIAQVTIDDHNNAIGRYPGRDSTARLAVVAHIDTVFPREVDVTVSRSTDCLMAPGIGDNSTSVGSMLHLAAAWKHASFTPPFDVLFVGNACEEGLGDLQGVKGLLDDYAQRADVDLQALISIDGRIGEVTNAGIGVRRLKVEVTAEGGHSWADFGSSSATHALGAAIEGIAQLEVPSDPRTVYNVGVVEGGTSVNTIAEWASMLIDMRSVAVKPLQELEERVRGLIDSRCSEFGADYTIEVVGDRPVGRIEESHPLVQVAKAVGSLFDLSMPTRAASTDANVPLSRGIPAITVGVYRGEGTHRESECMRPSSLKQGLPLGLLILLGAVDWLGAKLEA